MQKVFLIGLSGSGKSTVGHILAERLGKPLIDIDALVEKECGKPISAIFAQHGEDYFRSCESRMFTYIAQARDTAVIVTGGGIVTRPENRSILRELGVCIYLSVDPKTALERLTAQHTQALIDGKTPEVRPLLAGPDPLATLQNLLKARSDWYADAHFTCSTHGKSPERIAQEIIAMLISSGELVADPPIVLVRRVHIAEGYNVVVDWGGLGRLGQNLKMLNLPPRVFLITDRNVRDLYASMIIGTLSFFGFDPQLYTV